MTSCFGCSSARHSLSTSSLQPIVKGPAGTRTSSVAGALASSSHDGGTPGASPPEVFAPTGDPDEIAAVAELIEPAKAEAVRRWHALHTVELAQN